jgi:hypothetical protein
MLRKFFALTLVLCGVAATTLAAGNRMVIYDGNATELAPSTLPNTTDLWVTLADLKRATRFEIKPKGVCRDELCFPLPKARTKEFINKQGKTTWFNLSEFARLIRQPVASDAEHSLWYFGPRADEQNGFISSLMAPDFKLPDMQGKLHALSDYRGKKVLLITWASW